MTFPSLSVVGATALIMIGASSSPLRAQGTSDAIPAAPGGTGAVFGPTALTERGGWTVLPNFTYGGVWDDNVLVQEQNDDPEGDFQNALNPGLDLAFSGRRSQFNSSYNGTFVRYLNLQTLNSYDQHGDASARFLVTRHTSIFATNSFNVSPTTELADLVGVPFVRTGSRVENLTSGFNIDLSKRTSLSAAYDFEWVDFDDDPELGTALLGGHSHGVSLGFRRHLTERIALTGDYDYQHATVAAEDGFNIHNGWTGAEYQPTPTLTISGAFGLSHLGVHGLAPGRFGPAVRAGLSREFERAQVGVSYSRSFVPSYSFGGTLQNEEVNGHLSIPLGRAFVASSLSWRKNEPLEVGGDQLKSLQAGGSVGYAVAPWLTVEGFYDGAFQNIDRPGGRLSRNRVGFQIVTSKPMRIR